MDPLTVIILASPLIVVAGLIGWMVGRKIDLSTDEKLNRHFVFRAEPHSDQTTELPNRLRDNSVTGG